MQIIFGKLAKYCNSSIFEGTLLTFKSIKCSPLSFHMPHQLTLDDLTLTKVFEFKLILDNNYNFKQPAALYSDAKRSMMT